jgi:hypothetical protein
MWANFLIVRSREASPAFIFLWHDTCNGWHVEFNSKSHFSRTDPFTFNLQGRCRRRRGKASNLLFKWVAHVPPLVAAIYEKTRVFKTTL